MAWGRGMREGQEGSLAPRRGRDKRGFHRRATATDTPRFAMCCLEVRTFCHTCHTCGHSLPHFVACSDERVSSFQTTLTPRPEKPCRKSPCKKRLFECALQIHQQKQMGVARGGGGRRVAGFPTGRRQRTLSLQQGHRHPTFCNMLVYMCMYVYIYIYMCLFI